MSANLRLTPYFAKRSAAGVRMSDSLEGHVGRVLEMLDSDDGRARVSEVLQQLFPFAELDSQNSSLGRVIRSFNDAAKKQALPVRMRVTSNKKAGATRRFVWFEGPPPAPQLARLTELDRVGAGELLSSSATEGLPTVVLITYNEHETAAVLNQFGASNRPVTEARGSQSYTHLGEFAGRRIVHLISPQGEAQSQESTANAIRSWRPEAVLAVGVAFGVDQDKQSIGDVLVAQAVQGYELVRRSSGGIDLRDIARPATRRMWQRAIACDHTRKAAKDPRWPAILVGVVLSGSSLVDDIDYRDALVALVPHKVQGGEMEAIGLSIPADNAKVDWIVVKGICDFADGNKNRDKEANQKLAAANAALVVHEMLAEAPMQDQPRQSHAMPRQLWNDGGSCAPEDETQGAALPGFAGGIDLRLLTDRGTLISDRLARASGVSKRDARATAAGEPVDAVVEISTWANDEGAPPVMVLMGEYGMGKTVTAQKVAVDLHQRRQDDPTQRAPLYFDLRSVTGLDNRVPTLAETVLECMNRDWPHSPESGAYTWETFNAWVSQPALVIFDGLDEVLVKLNAADGHAFTRTLLGLLDPVTRPSLRVLVTCRSQYFPTLEQQWNHFTGQERGNTQEQQFRALTLLPLTSEQVRWYLQAALPDVHPDQVMALIAEVHNLTELSERPYTLRLISEEIAELEQLRQTGRPIHGVTLYRLMVERWLERDSGKHHIKPEHKLLLAESIAAHLARRRTNALPHEDLEGFLHEWLAGSPSLASRYQRLHPDQLEEDLRTATFLSRIDTNAGSLFRFAHTSLAEYFLARHLYRAIDQDQPQAWNMPLPSTETLDFLGQLLQESPIAGQLQRLATWGRTRGEGRNELLLAYTLHATKHSRPAPTLIGLDLEGADLRDHVIAGTRQASFSLREANMTNTRLDRAELRHADLRGAILTNAQVTQAVFSDADLSATTWEPRPARDCVLARCTGIPARALGAHRIIESGAPGDSAGWELVWETGASARAVGFSPDGTMLATAGGDGVVRLWDPAAGELIRTLEGHNGWVSAVGFSPDGTMLATAGDDGVVRLWDPAAGELIRTLEGHNGGVSAVGFSPDGTMLAAAGYDGVVRLWDPAAGELIRTLEGHNGRVSAVGFSPDGTMLATAGDDGVVRILAPRTMEQVLAIGIVRGGVASGYAVWSGDAERLSRAAGDAWRCLSWRPVGSTDWRERAPIACPAE